MKKLILLLLLSLIFIPNAYAKTSTASAKMKSDYQLPYPGTLADNPLYKIKVLRDKAILLMTSDPKQKVQQHLLQADKGYAMLPLLVNKKEIALAKETAFKAENHMTELTFSYKENNSQPDTKTFEKLTKATQKHQEILESVIREVDKNSAKEFQRVINFSKTNLEELEKLIKN